MFIWDGPRRLALWPAYTKMGAGRPVLGVFSSEIRPFRKIFPWNDHILGVPPLLVEV